MTVFKKYSIFARLYKFGAYDGNKGNRRLY